MVGIWGSHTSVFLQVVAVFGSVVFTLPIFLVPFRWARVLGWRIPDEADLALYFGRCLGAVGCVVAGFALYVSGRPTLQPLFMQLLIGICAALTWVHILGAIQRVQPMSETIEIAFWAGLTVVTLCFYPVGR